MSEIFYTFGELDERVRPLVFFIRTWAKEYGIIQPFPSLSISNFMLTCLVIFFLQRLPKPLLPPADTFVKRRETSNDQLRYITDSAALHNFKSENTSTLAELVVEFFEFYKNFNYSTDAISITNGAIKANISADSIYIYNPLECGVNVSRNICDFERNQFIEKCEFAHRALTMDRPNAVELLELWSKRAKKQDLDTFVNDMVKSRSNPNQNPMNNRTKAKKSVDNRTTKFDDKSLLKTI